MIKVSDLKPEEVAPFKSRIRSGMTERAALDVAEMLRPKAGTTDLARLQEAQLVRLQEAESLQRRTDAFMRLGLSESAALIAAKGRR